MVERIYLDNNASTPLDQRVLLAVYEALLSCPGNPSSIHSFGREARQKISEARDLIADYLGVKPGELVFTSGATEALNMVLRGYFELNPKGHIITSDLEHPCVFNTVKYLEGRGCEATYLNSGLPGAITPEAVREAIRPNTKLITLMAVNNETGVKTDIEAIAAIAQAEGIPFVVDGVVLLGKEPIIIPQGVSAMCFSAHKLHAPKGIGLAYIKRKFKVAPLLLGGEHENGRRAGTENLPGIVGFGKAVELLRAELPEAMRHMETLRNRLEQGILDRFSNIRINGEGPRICNTTNIAFLGCEGETLLAQLDMAGIAVSHGSACSSGALQPSRILTNMGLSQEVARSSIRFSLSRMNTLEEIDRTLAILNRILTR